MPWDYIKRNWKRLSVNVQEQWDKLTDSEVSRIDGEREQLSGLLQRHYGITKQQAETDLDAFAKVHAK